MVELDPKFIFFVGSPLSNWYPAKFKSTVRDWLWYFNCSEQYMMFIKALTFSDGHIAREVMLTKSPKTQKALGRQVKGYDDKVWRRRSWELFYPGLLAKFDQDDECKKYLEQTGDGVLVEAAPWDKIWGIGMGANHPDINDPSKWQGENKLGKMLMKVRSDLFGVAAIHV